MKKIYREYLYVPRNGSGKVKEKVFFSRITIAMVFIVACLVAMSMTAYAYFSTGITSGSNIISAAHYDLKISVNVDNSNDSVALSADTTEDYRGAYVYPTGATEYTAEGNHQYKITLTKPDEKGIASTGYCQIDVYKNGSNTPNIKIFTQQIGVVSTNEDGTVNETSPITFTIIAPAGYKFVFTPQWGTYGANPVALTDDTVVSSDIFVEDGGKIDLTEGETTTVGSGKTTVSNSISNKTQSVANNAVSSVTNNNETDSNSTTSSTESTSSNSDLTDTTTDQEQTASSSDNASDTATPSQSEVSGTESTTSEDNTQTE